MRSLLITLLATAALAQSPPQILASHTAESLRGVSVVSRKIAWASGTHGTYLRTTDGRLWQPAQVPGAESSDFRAVVAFSADEAFLMSSGPGDQSRIYHTTDAGQHWQLQLSNPNPKAFFDSMVFWDRTHGLVLGDPILDESGKLKFELLLTDDGQTWRQLATPNLPTALEGEGAFAASNTCIAILPTSLTSQTAGRQENPQTDVIPNAGRSEKDLTTPGSTDAVNRIAQPQVLSPNGRASAPRKPFQKIGASAREANADPNIWFATGGKAARVFHSPDRSQTWQVTDTPIFHGPDSAGIFSIAFKDANHGVIAGGDYKHPDKDGPNLAFTDDGGKTWTLSKIHPQAYFSAAAYDRKPANEAGVQERILLIGQNFIFDFRPPANPTRISPKTAPDIKFNAVAPYPEGGALIVGPKGALAAIP